MAHFFPEGLTASAGRDECADVSTSDGVTGQWARHAWQILHEQIDRRAWTVFVETVQAVLDERVEVLLPRHQSALSTKPTGHTTAATRAPTMGANLRRTFFFRFVIELSPPSSVGIAGANVLFPTR